MTQTERTVTRLEIDGQPFTLRPDYDVANLMTQIENAARDNPAFVTLTTPAGLTSVLITSNTRVVVVLADEDTHSDAPADIGPYSDWEF